ncbi:hypothetical protein Q3G72_023186 [Acer saccharum]|nr:hypothetical protein Q3G72_023186 [Acer saccharum]
MNKITALVVDDNTVNQTMHHRLLENLGIENQVVKNGKEAVDVHSSGKYFDLILMDMDMPIMNGIEATRTLRAMGIRCMIAGVSTRSLDQEKQEFMEAENTWNTDFRNSESFVGNYLNPTDLVKVRLQAEAKLAPGVPRRYTGALNAYSTIVRQEGIGPNVARNAIINAAELASYDQVKQTILKIPGFTDNVVTHLFAGLGAGFFAVCIGSPVDVVKSRMMGDAVYKSTLDCFIKTLKKEGPLAFYKGFLPNFGRLGSWNVIMFLTLEQAKKIVRELQSSGR